VTDDRNHPWPRSWPPFWRAVLQVGIAAAVGNVVLGAAFVGTHAVRIPWCVMGAPWCVSALATVFVCCRLARAERRMTRVLLLAFGLGTLVGEHGDDLIRLVVSQEHLSLFFAGLEKRFGEEAARALFTVATEWADGVLAFGVIGALFVILGRYALSRRVCLALIVGVIATTAAHAWTACAVHRTVEWVGRSLGPLAPLAPFALVCFLSYLSCLALFPLAYALTSRMLIGAARRKGEQGEEDAEANRDSNG